MKNISAKRKVDLTAIRLLFSLVSICFAGSLVGANGLAKDDTNSFAPIEVKAKQELKIHPAPDSSGYCNKEEQTQNKKCEPTNSDLLKILDQYPYINIISWRAASAARSIRSVSQSK